VLYLITENLARTSQDKCGAIMFAVCTDSAAVHGGLDVSFELSVHTGDTMQQEISDDQCQQQ
jgi:hypothetical protein